MKHSVLLALSFLLLVACSKKQEQDSIYPEKTGTASTTVSGEIIAGDLGYIVEGATLSEDASKAEFSIKGLVGLSKGSGNVLIVRTQTEDGGTELLALQFPGFAEGTKVDFAADDKRAGFWVFGFKDKKEVMSRTGSIAGTVRLVKQAPATITLGLNREVVSGIGEMEIVVSGIDGGGLKVQAEKKYAARFELPMITLDELSRINQPI